MTCRMVGTKSLSEPVLEYFEIELTNKFKWNLMRNSYIIIQENAFENVVWKQRPSCIGLNVLSPDIWQSDYVICT